jgi:hypothetical protein
MKTVTLEVHQTMLDLALQHCGSADALVEIASLNDVEITEELPAGSLVIVPEAYDKQRVKFLLNGNHKPFTGPLNRIDEAGQGLEFWAIEIDFVIN